MTDPTATPPGVGRAGDRDPGPARLAIPAQVLERLEAGGLAITGMLDAVERRIVGQVGSSHAFVDQLARYLIDAGGKRFRPLLVALTGHLGPDHPGSDHPGLAGVPPASASPAGVRVLDDLVDAAVIVELVHLATLYHDDVIDEAVARRGAPSANARWDNTIAILTGDYLFARASELSADLGVEVTRIMARTLARLCEGQIAELQGSTGALPADVPRLEPTEAHYLEVVAGKTASLIETSCRFGALLTGVDAAGVDAAARYGWNVGMAFQLSDDILDIAALPEESGKTPGTDLREGVRTLPVLYALQAEPDGELAELLGRDLAEADEEVDRALALLRSGPGIDLARAAAAAYVEAAVDALGPFGDVPAGGALTSLARYALDRVG